MAKPLFMILLLGSYDLQTKEFMEKIKEEIVKNFSGENVFVLILDHVEMYHAGIVHVLTESYDDNKATVLLFQNDQLIDINDISLENANLDATVYAFLKGKYKIREMNRTTIFDKLKALMQIAGAIFLVRHKEETRGGEYLELMHALFLGHSGKIWFFKRNEIELSAMLLEYLERYKVIMRTYRKEKDLIESVIRIVKYRIQENTQQPTT